MAAETIALVGESGTGKSTALRNLNPEETFIISTTGKPLPFFSYGGTSLLATLLMAGIVLALSRADEEWVRYECENRRRRLRVTTRVNGHRRAHR